MKTIKRYLLAQRKDGLFLHLNEGRNSTSFEFVSEPELATRRSPWKEKDFLNPEPASYYFENSYRAREIWLKECEMVTYEITEEVIARKCNDQ